jgi:acyl carrier protein
MTLNAHVPNSTVPSREQVLAEVRRIVAQFAAMPADEIEERHALYADLGYDSLDDVETIMELEEHFDISIPEGQETSIKTVGDIVDGVVRLLASEQA